MRKLIVGTLIAAVAAGCATAGRQAEAPGQVVAERQRLMKLHAGLWKDIQEKAKAGNIEMIAPSAEALALNARHIPSLFPEGSLTENSKAKPEIWQRWPEFQQAARTLEAEAVRLRDAAAARNAEATQALVKDFGRKACGSCHAPFRVPPQQQRS